jgi:hypothetical protein
MLANVLLHDFFVHLPYRLGKIPIRPKTLPPQKFFQFRVFLPKHSTRPPFEYLHHLGHTVLRRYLHHKMNVIFLNAHLADPPPVHPTGLVQKSSETDGYFASQDSFPIFRYPYQMILKPMLRVGPCYISGHNQIMPDWPPLRQLKLASFQVPFIPRLESLGFSGGYIKNSQRKEVIMV